MTAEIVNLRQFRKAKARSEKEKQAEQNRISHGRTKSEKKLTEALNTIERKRLDSARLEAGSPVKEEDGEPAKD